MCLPRPCTNPTTLQFQLYVPHCQGPEIFQIPPTPPFPLICQNLWMQCFLSLESYFPLHLIKFLLTVQISAGFSAFLGCLPCLPYTCPKWDLHQCKCSIIFLKYICHNLYLYTSLHFFNETVVSTGALAHSNFSVNNCGSKEGWQLRALICLGRLFI